MKRSISHASRETIFASIVLLGITVTLSVAFAGSTPTLASYATQLFPTGTIWAFFDATTTPDPLELTPRVTPLGDGFSYGNDDPSAGKIGNVLWYSDWGVDIGDRHLDVYVGVYQETTTGVVHIEEYTSDGRQLPDGGDYLAPRGSGPLRIVGAVGKRLILRSDDGQTMYFDVPGQTFTKSMTDSVPTVTPWPVTPIPSLTPTLIGDASHDPDDVNGLTQVNSPLHLILHHMGDQQWFRFRMCTTGTLQVHLDNLPADYDLYVYSVTRVTRGVYGGIDGISTNSGTTSEVVIIQNAPVDDYMVQVVSVDGAFDPVHPYTLEIDVPAVCGPTTATPG